MRLTIRQIDTIPIRVALPRLYRGSYYQMTHRSTIVTRIHMDEGFTGEVFTGDEDHINRGIERVIRDEITPRLIGEDALATERCWELARPATFNILWGGYRNKIGVIWTGGNYAADIPIEGDSGRLRGWYLRDEVQGRWTFAGERRPALHRGAQGRRS
jgi:hypothetical protein